MFEAFSGRFLQNSYWFCVCATTALRKNEKKKQEIFKYDEAWYGYHRPTKNVFKMQENDHLSYSSENIIFPLKCRFFVLSIS